MSQNKTRIWGLSLAAFCAALGLPVTVAAQSATEDLAEEVQPTEPEAIVEPAEVSPVEIAEPESPATGIPVVAPKPPEHASVEEAAPIEEPQAGAQIVDDTASANTAILEPEAQAAEPTSESAPLLIEEPPPTFVQPDTVAEPVAPPASASEYGKSDKKSIAFFGLALGEGIPDSVAPLYRQKIREAVETSRFYVHAITPAASTSMDRFAGLLADYLDKHAVDLARQEAEYDIRFKDYAITAELLQKVLDSAYVYRPTASATFEREVQQVTRVGPNGEKMTFSVAVYTATVKVELGVRKLDVNTRSFAPLEVKTVETKESASQSVERVNGAYVVTPSEGEVKLNALRAVANGHWLRRKLRVAIAKHRDFQISGILASKRLISGRIDVSAKDGLETDTVMQLIETRADGREKRKGWVKVKRLGDGETDKQSKVAILSAPVGPDGGEIAYEYPLLLVEVLPGVAILPSSFKGFNDPRFGEVGEVSKPLAYGIEAWDNLGRRLNASISEFLVGAFGYFSPAASNVYEVHVGAGIGKRFRIGRLTLMPEVTGKYQMILMTATQNKANVCAVDKDGNEDCLFMSGMAGVAPGMRAELFLHPRFSLGSTFRYNVLGEHKWVKRSTDVGADEPNELSVKLPSPYGQKGPTFFFHLVFTL